MAGRPKNPDTNYKVSLHKCGAYRYAATQPTITDEETGVKVRKYIYWGDLTEDMRFIPNERYLLASEETRSKLIFPSDWDISEALDKFKLPPSKPKETGLTTSDARAFGGTVGVNPAADQFNNRFYGGPWLLWHIAEKKDVIKDLTKVFGSQTVVNDILTLAMFPVLTDMNYSQTERWQKYTKTPSDHSLSPSAITRLTRFIEDDHRMRFLKLRIDSQKPGAVVACDSTTRSAYGRCLADIRWGNNKDNEALKNTLEVVVYSLETHEPIYYRTFGGNESDMRTLKTIISDLQALGCRDLMIIFDRGYESKENIENMIRSDQSFLVCGKTGQEPVYSSIRALSYDAQGLPKDMHYSEEYKLYTYQTEIERTILMNPDDQASGTQVKLKVNLFLNIAERMKELIGINAAIKAEEELLKEHLNQKKTKTELNRLKKECPYHKLSLTKDSEVLIAIRKEDAITKAKAIAGFFSSVSYKVEGDAIDQYRLYSLRDEQEKYFECMKDQLGFNMQRNWREDTKTGRLFILFIGLILHSEIRKIWKTKLKKSYPSSVDVLHEMLPIRYVEYDNGTSHITGFTGAQVEICTAFGVPIPEACLSSAQKATLERMAAGRKRGRPKGSLNKKSMPA